LLGIRLQDFLSLPFCSGSCAETNESSHWQESVSRGWQGTPAGEGGVEMPSIS